VFIEDAQGDVMELDQILRDNGFVKLDSYEEK
jgi:hypothetical protein